MGTDIYTVSCGDKKPWHELIPSKIKGVLKHPGPHDRLLVFAELASPDSISKERDYFCNVSNIEFKDFYDFDPEDYDVDTKECTAFFDTHFFYLYCYDIPDIAVSASSVSSLYIRVAKFLKVLQASDRHFLICVSQEFGAHTMFFTNCGAAVVTSTNETAKPTTQPEPLKWLSAEQREVLSLRLELLRRDYLVWRYDKDKVEYPKELFENSDKFITACYDGTLLDGASDIFGYHALRSKRQNVLSLQGLGYLCDCPDKAAKILNMLKPYLDAVYDLPTPVKEDSDNE